MKVNINGQIITTRGISKSDLESGKIKITVTRREKPLERKKKTKNKYPKHPALKQH